MRGNGEDERNSGEIHSTLMETTTRIFVGGLGGAVTPEDLRTTFGCLGRVESVEIIRTKGRSFAYLDFVPSSDKSLSKLFSMYNGCMWKGRRLKLEKAKEHYCMKQERNEASEFSNNTINDATKSMVSLEKLNRGMDPKTSEIRLFFPKLRKLRPLPFNGTGKHKYNFQRIEVPALPIHFCDCDEHCKPVYPAQENKLFVRETQDGGIDEKELNIMESVMNKLFDRDNKSKADISMLGLVNERENAPGLVDVRKGSLKGWRQETNLDNELSKYKPLDNKPMSQRVKTMPSQKKRKEPNFEPTEGQSNFNNDLTLKTNFDAKLLEVKNDSKNAVIRSDLIDEGEAGTEPVDNIAVNENEADEMTENEDDNLVLNMVGGINIRRQSLEGLRKERILENKWAEVDGTKSSEMMAKNQRNKALTSEEKRKSPYDEASVFKIDSMDIEGKRSARKVGSHHLTQATKLNYYGSLLKKKDATNEKHMIKISNTNEEILYVKRDDNHKQKENLLQDLGNLSSKSNASKEPIEVAAPEKSNSGVIKQPIKGTMWAQKSSWTNLVGGRDASFSISQLLPEIN